MKINGNLSVQQLVALSMLTTGDYYGYQLAGESEVINKSSVYNLLASLEKNELVSSKWGEGTGARKKIYSITEKGKMAEQLLRACLQLLWEFKDIANKESSVPQST